MLHPSEKLRSQKAIDLLSGLVRFGLSLEKTDVQEFLFLMKILYLVRHAKSGWGDYDQVDHERTLADRGQKDALQMGKELAEQNVTPQLIMSSSAVRAKTTAEVIASEIGYDKSQILVSEDIFQAEVETLLELVQGVEGGLDKIMLVGHNPAITDFLNGLTQCGVDNVPTCGVAVIGFRVDHWSDIREGSGNLLLFTYPKKLG